MGWYGGEDTCIFLERENRIDFEVDWRQVGMGKGVIGWGQRNGGKKYRARHLELESIWEVTR